MTQAINTTSNTHTTKPNTQAWYRPTFSPEHGVYVVLLVSFLIGAATAQNWTIATTLALVCAFCGFQAEHPLVLQIKQRRSLKPRFLIWGGVYAVISGAIALALYLKYPVLLWLYAGAVAALVVDAFSVLHREQKSVFNELVTFAAVCLSTPFAYAATTGTILLIVIGLWTLNTLYFSSTIFTVKMNGHAQELLAHPTVKLCSKARIQTIQGFSTQFFDNMNGLSQSSTRPYRATTSSPRFAW